MKCETAIDLVIDSMMDSPDETAQTDLSNHLAGCRSCASEAARLTTIWSDLGDVAAPAVGPRAGLRFGRLLASKERQVRFRPMLRMAAAIALLLLGGSGGYWLRGPETAVPGTVGGGNSYLLLVRGPDFVTGQPPEVIVGEYVAWAEELATRGMLVGANKLTEEPGRWISGGEVPDSRTTSDVSGYYVINAANYDQAVATARESPHIRYGGTFEIRQVDLAN